ncbi:hypothetical protein LINPERHAP1_LOCUS17526 [Linum perenne]
MIRSSLARPTQEK